MGAARATWAGVDVGGKRKGLTPLSLGSMGWSRGLSVA